MFGCGRRRALLALLFATPSFSAPSSPNDLFRALEAQRPKPAEDPICCLRPLPSLEPDKEEDILLSFEDWKAKRLAAPDVGERPPVSSPPESASSESADLASQAVVPQQDVVQPQSVEAVDVHFRGPHASPHFLVPLHDRFNYANLDCSARVHTSHREAKSPSSILSSKKDRYMLSPCTTAQQYVVVELCDDIRIDTVQLANFEFFSGVFKEFSVSVSKTYTTDPAGWTQAGTYRAKNVRGVQSFHPPTSLRDFYRYIRIDFLSHYGNEYYCPLSLLRVYGLTHLEEWKWEIWETESRARKGVTDEVPLILSSDVSAEVEPVVSPVAETVPVAPTEVATTAADSSSQPEARVAGDFAMSTQEATAVGSSNDQAAASMPKTEASLSTEALGATSTSLSPPVSSDRPPTQASTSAQLSELTGTPPLSVLQTAEPISSSTATSVEPNPSPDSIASTPTTKLSSVSIPVVSSSPRSSSIIPLVVPTISSSVSLNPYTGGESVYRVIMNRLLALEANTTLYARYLEEQTTGMREVLRRVTEDVGRLEGIGRSQAQTYRRTVNALEQERLRIQSEHGELLSRVNYLAEEVLLEKRLGIAQLCLLLTVLIFMALTRGSRGEPALINIPPRSRMRDWSRRNLSISGNWVNRLRTRSFPSISSNSSNQERPAVASNTGVPFPNGQDLDLPEMDQPTKPRLPVEKRFPTTVAPPRTPRGANRHFPTHHRTVTPVGIGTVRRPLQRSNSHGTDDVYFVSLSGGGQVPRSARRWARSAHLHEVSARPPAATLPRSRPQTAAAEIGTEQNLKARGRTVAVAEAVHEGEAADDVFVLPRNGPGRPERRSWLRGSGTAQVVNHALRRPPSPLRFSASGRAKSRSSSPLVEVVGVDPPHSTDADGWEDTDTDTDTELSGSDVEGGAADMVSAEELFQLSL